MRALNCDTKLIIGLLIFSSIIDNINTVFSDDVIDNSEVTCSPTATRVAQNIQNLLERLLEQDAADPSPEGSIRRQLRDLFISKLQTLADNNKCQKECKVSFSGIFCDFMHQCAMNNTKCWSKDKNHHHHRIHKNKKHKKKKLKKKIHKNIIKLFIGKRCHSKKCNKFMKSKTTWHTKKYKINKYYPHKIHKHKKHYHKNHHHKKYTCNNCEPDIQMLNSCANSFCNEDLLVQNMTGRVCAIPGQVIKMLNNCTDNVNCNFVQTTPAVQGTNGQLLQLLNNCTSSICNMTLNAFNITGADCSINGQNVIQLINNCTNSVCNIVLNLQVLPGITLGNIAQAATLAGNVVQATQIFNCTNNVCTLIPNPPPSPIVIPETFVGQCIQIVNNCTNSVCDVILNGVVPGQNVQMINTNQGSAMFGADLGNFLADARQRGFIPLDVIESFFNNQQQSNVALFSQVVGGVNARNVASLPFLRIDQLNSFVRGPEMVNNPSAGSPSRVLSDVIVKPQKSPMDAQINPQGILQISPLPEQLFPISAPAHLFQIPPANMSLMPSSNQFFLLPRSQPATPPQTLPPKPSTNDPQILPIAPLFSKQWIIKHQNNNTPSTIKKPHYRNSKKHKLRSRQRRRRKRRKKLKDRELMIEESVEDTGGGEENDDSNDSDSESEEYSDSESSDTEESSDESDSEDSDTEEDDSESPGDSSNQSSDDESE